MRRINKSFFVYKINYSVGSYLATDQTQTKLRMESRIEDEDIRMLEQAIDVIDNELPPLNAFYSAGG